MRNLSEQIEALIVGGNLQTGARLPSERQLASDFGVSRSSLREAIQQLVSRGRLVSRRGGGTYVTEPPMEMAINHAFSPLNNLMRDRPDYWQDVMEIRTSLEGDAAFFAAKRATNADKVRLRQELIRVSDSLLKRDQHSSARTDADFHMAIAHASHNAVLIQVMAGLFDLMEQSISHSLERLYQIPSTVETLERQHATIVDAILAGRADQARDAALEHLSYVDERLRPLEEAAARQRRLSHAFPQSLSLKDA
jgi:GntR family transcriptional regulator, L-lactate dehydrogenase operon regulator